MRKKLLFIMPGLDVGGGEKSLVNLLREIDYKQYEVDLFLFNHNGVFTAYVPEEVRILPLPEDYRLFSLPYIKAVSRFIRKGKLGLAFHRTIYSAIHKLKLHHSIREQRSWRFLAPAIGEFPMQYDAVIGFLEKTSIYCCIDKAKGYKKIGWIHTDYDKLGMDPGFDRPYFERLDTVVTVSEQCASILSKRFPNLEHKVKVIHNIVSPEMIVELSDQNMTGTLKHGKEFVILSIGRLHAHKGLDMAVGACRLLIDQGYDVRWHIIGDGEERSRLEHLIRKLGLENHMKLLGVMLNPYPYMKEADLYVHPSRVEGKSIAIDEAKIMRKPIIVTNFRTAKDQINHEEDGLIVDMNAGAIAEGIQRLIHDDALREQFTANLSRQRLGTADEIAKLYQIV